MLPWLIIGGTALVALRIFARRRRQVQTGVTSGFILVDSGRNHRWWPWILLVNVMGIALFAVTYRDMALDQPLWIGGVDTLLALLAFVWMLGRLPAARTFGLGQCGLVFSALGWLAVVGFFTFTGEGPGLLADVQQLVSQR